MTSALWRCQHEWLYSRIHAAYGLPVAATEMAESGSGFRLAPLGVVLTAWPVIGASSTEAAL